jgi:catechol 2,3-dioxygenase-like lactoylglutathione lyase family enzyme
MKKTILILIVVVSSSYSIAQSFSIKLDHYSIIVEDSKKSGDFYKNILQLKEIETPWGFLASGKFFDIGNKQQLHFIEYDAEIKLHKYLHYAFTVNDFDGYLEFLNDRGIKYSNFKGDISESQTRPDGVRQIYFKDPDGYWIEINDAKH